MADDITGLAELKEALAAKAKELRALTDATVAEETALLHEDVKAHAPHLSGDLRDHVTFEVAGEVGTVRSSSRHAAAMEYGTFKDAAQPSMTPALERSRARFLEGAVRRFKEVT